MKPTAATAVHTRADELQELVCQKAWDLVKGESPNLVTSAVAFAAREHLKRHSRLIILAADDFVLKNMLGDLETVVPHAERHWLKIWPDSPWMDPGEKRLLVADRLKALLALARATPEKPAIILTDLFEGLRLKTPLKDLAQPLTLAPGVNFQRDKFVAHLLAMGFERITEDHDPFSGQFRLVGERLTLHSFAHPMLTVLFDGDTIEEIRAGELKVEEVQIPVAKEIAFLDYTDYGIRSLQDGISRTMKAMNESSVTLDARRVMGFLGEATMAIKAETGPSSEFFTNYRQGATPLIEDLPDDEIWMLDSPALLAGAKKHLAGMRDLWNDVEIPFRGAEAPSVKDREFVKIATDAGGDCPMKHAPFLDSVDQATLEKLAQPYGKALLYTVTPLGFNLEEAVVAQVYRPLSRGFMVDGEFLVLSEHELFPSRFSFRTEDVTALDNLDRGDLVVHEQYGIGKFAGAQLMHIGSVAGEYIQVDYAGTDKVFLPVQQMHRLRTYINLGGHAPTIHGLNQQRWEALKKKVKKSLEGYAQELYSRYAIRIAQPGRRYNVESGTLFKHVVEDFPFEETYDQTQAIEEIRSDMASNKPMDRIICGDVGFGKTEVALRSAALALDNGFQVAVLAPTTLLSRQHYEVFHRRLAPFGVKVELFNRLKTTKEIEDGIKACQRGDVHVAVGTHRLLSDDVSFKNLGLLVVDEEQRFGVKQKEKIKSLRADLDVLTLTATPIPRTLQMSLVGTLQMSKIYTPPKGRIPVQTYLEPYNRGMIKQAVLAEIARGGQVFYLHNRVEDLSIVYRDLKEMLPSVKMTMAHGQMPPMELEKVMVSFLKREVDMLLCTTIIESGIDIESVNTIVVDNSERLGLSQMYQIRGRVGRGTEKAHAYFFYEPVGLSDDAKRRMESLLDFTALGSGYELALRDLELRGAGVFLGTRQHGQVANVGFDLYCRLLEESINEIKGTVEVNTRREVLLDFDHPAFFPTRYVDQEKLRLSFYRRVLEAETPGELSALAQEIRSQFGPLPDEARALFQLGLTRQMLARIGCDRLVSKKNNTFMLLFFKTTEFIDRVVKKAAKHQMSGKREEKKVRLDMDTVDSAFKLHHLMEMLADVLDDDLMVF